MNGGWARSIEVARVALLGHGGKPWAYPPSKRCVARGETPPDWPAESLIVALERRHAEDTWFQALTTPETAWPRFAKALLLEIENWPGVEPVLSYAVLDLDRPDHRADPWPDAEAADSALRATLARLERDGWPNAWGYATRGGLRIGWTLAVPIPLVKAQSFLDQLHAAMPDGLPVTVDGGVKDWTRGYRLPWCPREDGKVPAWGDAPPPMEISALREGRTLAWTPAELTDERVTPEREWTLPPRPDNPTPADARIGPNVEKWAREIAASGSRHALLLAKGKALGGYVQGAINRGMAVSLESFAASLVAAGGDSNAAEEAVWWGIGKGREEPLWFEERPLERVDLARAVQRFGRATGRAEGETAEDDSSSPGIVETPPLDLGPHHIGAVVRAWLDGIGRVEEAPDEWLPLPGGLGAVREQRDGFTAAQVAPRRGPPAARWSNLHRLIGPWRTDTFAVLVGQPGRGKSAMAVQAAAEAARGGWPVLYVSVEMGAAEVAARMVAVRSEGTDAALRNAGPRSGFSARFVGVDDGVHWRDVKPGQGDPIGLRMAAEALVRDCPALYVFAPGKASAGDVVAMARAVSAAHGGRWPFVVLDYLQRLTTEAKDRRGAVAGDSGLLRQLSIPSGDWRGACVLALSSAGRQGYGVLASVASLAATEAANRGEPTKTKGEPTSLVGLGKESGEIEYDANIVLVMTTDPGEGARRRPALAVVAKHRSGDTGSAEMTFYPGSGVFTDAVAEPTGDGRRGYGPLE